MCFHYIICVYRCIFVYAYMFTYYMAIYKLSGWASKYLLHNMWSNSEIPKLCAAADKFACHLFNCFLQINSNKSLIYFKLIKLKLNLSV